MRDLTVGGRCGYGEFRGEHFWECSEMGLRFTVEDALGYLHSIVRCMEHSDWIGVSERQARAHSLTLDWNECPKKVKQ